MRVRRSNRFFSTLLVIAIVVFTLTASISLPIYIRPFYYAHVDLMDMEYWGEEPEDIIEAYDEVLNFLTLKDREFGTGKLDHSEEGKKHFEDCKVLFDLNKNALFISFGLIVFIMILSKLRIIKLARPKGYPLSFVAGVSTLVLCAVVGLLASIDFSIAFTVFHKIFFPGKDNWVFDPSDDPIIYFMPQEFFRNCAILIGASILIFSLFFMIRGIKKRR